MKIQPITPTYRNEVNEILKKEWDCPPSVSRGRAIDTTTLDGFIFLENGKIKGLITYNIENTDCEIATLISLSENKGIGTALVEATKAAAKENACTRLWLITTNDNTSAIRFYQKKGFEWVATHINAMDVAREIKPSIPLLGTDGIPIKHEIEFEMVI
ncbi:MAG: GNAT family N-acetyltransferase [Defluviitaleaceae bacterium]|nr:GNAT family N-acetyltransferase [Defluviitaleaceae bacterium]